jgi:hypothetical protein
MMRQQRFHGFRCSGPPPTSCRLAAAACALMLRFRKQLFDNVRLLGERRPQGRLTQHRIFGLAPPPTTGGPSPRYRLASHPQRRCAEIICGVDFAPARIRRSALSTPSRKPPNGARLRRRLQRR